MCFFSVLWFHAFSKALENTHLTCKIFSIKVLFWKSYSTQKCICPTFSLGSELSMYMMSIIDVLRFWNVKRNFVNITKWDCKQWAPPSPLLLLCDNNDDMIKMERGAECNGDDYGYVFKMYETTSTMKFELLRQSYGNGRIYWYEKKNRFAKNGVILFVIANRNSYCFCNSIESIKLNAFKQHIKMVIVIFFNWKHYGAYNLMHSEIFNPNDRFVRWFWASNLLYFVIFLESACS